MDKIDLDAIIVGELWDEQDKDFIHRYMKEAIHQALVLAGDEGYDASLHPNIENKTIGEAATYVKNRILDVEKLII